MKSTKCYQCGFVGWADAETCKKCGAAMQQRSADADPVSGTQPVQSNMRPGAHGAPQAGLKNGLAIGSLVVGILSCFTLGGIFGIGATVGVILGIVAMVKANRNPAEYGGKGLATAGLVTSVLSFVIIVPIGIIAAIAIPNLVGARRAGNEAASISVLRRIMSAEATYQSVHEKYGDMADLASERLIEPELVSSPRNGYRFTISKHEPFSFGASGVPVSYPNSGIRSFYIDESGVIRAADLHGAEATSSEPPLDNNPYSSSSSSRPPASASDSDRQMTRLG
jgi:type IV pilus assembly protein PilA